MNLSEIRLAVSIHRAIVQTVIVANGYILSADIKKFERDAIITAKSATKEKKPFRNCNF